MKKMTLCISVIVSLLITPVFADNNDCVDHIDKHNSGHTLRLSGCQISDSDISPILLISHNMQILALLT